MRSDGSVSCWGREPRERFPLPSGRFVSVDAGGRHACGLRGYGSVVCWGIDDQGQATPPDGEFVSVSTGANHACGLRGFYVYEPPRPLEEIESDLRALEQEIAGLLSDVVRS